MYIFKIEQPNTVHNCKVDKFHPALSMDLDLSLYSHNIFDSNTSQQSFNFRNCNYLLLYKQIANHHWFLLQYEDPNLALDSFYAEFKNCL